MKKHVLVWILTTALLACAWVLVKVTLPDDAPDAPFPAVAQIGEEAVTRNLVATVTDVHLTNRVTDAEGWSAEGTWLVIDLDAASGVTQRLSTLRLAELTIGERTFSATDRGTTFLAQRLVTAVPAAAVWRSSSPTTSLVTGPPCASACRDRAASGCCATA